MKSDDVALIMFSLIKSELSILPHSNTPPDTDPILELESDKKNPLIQPSSILDDGSFTRVSPRTELSSHFNRESSNLSNKISQENRKLKKYIRIYQKLLLFLLISLLALLYFTANKMILKSSQNFSNTSVVPAQPSSTSSEKKVVLKNQDTIYLDGSFENPIVANVKSIHQTSANCIENDRSLSCKIDVYVWKDRILPCSDCSGSEKFVSVQNSTNLRVRPDDSQEGVFGLVVNDKSKYRIKEETNSKWILIEIVGYLKK